MAGVLAGPGGVLHGTTIFGGAETCKYTAVPQGCGTVFSLAPPAASGEPWTEYVYSLSANGVGSGPYGGLVEKDGVLYGTTLGGGGSVFSLTPPNASNPQWSEVRLDGGAPPLIYPYDTPAIGANGVLYVTTWEGGTTFDSAGDLISLTPPASPGGSWTTTVLCALGGPETGVVFGSGGVLYGTTGNSVYSVTPPASPGGAWTPTTLYSFTGPPGDGIDTSAGVVIGAGGVLYGTTSYGGTGSCTNGIFKSGCGTVYSLKPPAEAGGAWAEQILYSFAGGSDGFVPNAVVIGPGGVLYGTTHEGGASNAGIVFSLRPPATEGGAWTETVLHTFTGGNDGGGPLGGLAFGPGNALYGTTYSGGSSNQGTVFALTP
ncbi:MAG: choice-of-anchor tandem repeat GloVer-containing protein [Bryobacteraceae bacterium]